MSISIQLTDEQAKQLAADIIKLNKPNEPLPLPEPPEGCHKAIMGPLKVKAGPECKDVAMFEYGSWKFGFKGVRDLFYALRIGSEIAKLNGLEPEAKPDTARREFDVHLGAHGDIWDCVEPNEEMDDGMTLVRVREIRPGDPTPEQVQALVDACWEWRDVPHHEDIRKALAPFRKP